MKSIRDVRGKSDNFDSADMLKKAMKLEPIKKSGKERHAIFGELEEEEELSLNYKKRESVLDYFDDGEEIDPDEIEQEEGEDDEEEYYDEDEEIEEEEEA